MYIGIVCMVVCVCSFVCLFVYVIDPRSNDLFLIANTFYVVGVLCLRLYCLFAC